jgi:hypothetical protein
MNGNRTPSSTTLDTFLCEATSPGLSAREYLTRGVCPARKDPHHVRYGVVEIGSFESLVFTLEECAFAQEEWEYEEGV